MKTILSVTFSLVVSFLATQCMSQERVPASELVNPRDTVVKVKIGGYRVSAYYNSGEGGNIASDGDEIEVTSPEVDRGIALGREFREKRDVRMASDVERLLKKPFTQIETRTVVIREPCPQPTVPYCYGLGRRTSNCCGITRNCNTPVVTSNCSCNGVGCSHCNTGTIGQYATYGNCAAWGRVGTLQAYYRDPPRGRQFWCNCQSHRQACISRYGNDCIWELVPCLCANGCSQCGGAGRCGH